MFVRDSQGLICTFTVSDIALCLSERTSSNKFSNGYNNSFTSMPDTKFYYQVFVSYLHTKIVSAQKKASF